MTQNFQTFRFVTLSVVAALFLTTSSVAAQEPEGVDQLEDWQQEELISLIEEVRQIVTEPSSGPAPFELGGFASQIGTDGDAYVAYNLTIDPSKISTPTVASITISSMLPQEEPSRSRSVVRLQHLGANTKLLLRFVTATVVRKLKMRPFHLRLCCYDSAFRFQIFGMERFRRVLF